MSLRPIELDALLWLHAKGGAVLLTAIPDKTVTDPVFGDRIPGLRTFESLNRQGYLLITEEEVDEQGFDWTPMVELLDKGQDALSRLDK